MEAARATFPIDIHTPWLDFSPALHWHATQTVDLALAAFASLIRSVTVRIMPRHVSDLDGRVCTVDVELQSSGSVSASSTGSDVYQLVDRATARVRVEIEQRVNFDASAMPLSRTA